MKQITLHVYQSIDGCPVGADKHFDAAADASCCVLIDGRTWVVRSSKVLEDGKIRTVYGKVCP